MYSPFAICVKKSQDIFNFEDNQ